MTSIQLSEEERLTLKALVRVYGAKLAEYSVPQSDQDLAEALFQKLSDHADNDLDIDLSTLFM